MLSGVWYLLGQEYRDIRENLADCFDWKGGDNVAVTAKKKIKPVVEAMTMSCEQAVERHQGQEERNIARMCLRGQRLSKKYGGWSKVPEVEKKTAIFAKKCGKYWSIPVAELDRLFLP